MFSIPHLIFRKRLCHVAESGNSVAFRFDDGELLPLYVRLQYHCRQCAGTLVGLHGRGDIDVAYYFSVDYQEWLIAEQVTGVIKCTSGAENDRILDRVFDVNPKL